MNGNPAVNGTTHTKTQRVYPSDWPALTGDIDLAVHDLPHASADTEWWYLNTHVETPDGRQFSAFASFFRCVATVDKKTGDLSHYHALSWGIVDVKSGKHYFDSQLPQNGHLAILEELNTKRLVVDHRIERAMREMCERGEVPKPDRKAEREATVGEKEFGLDYSGCTLTKDDAGRYHLHVEGLGNGFDLVFAPGKQGGKPYRQGHDGVVKLGRQGDEMFYYFFPNNVVSGSVNIGDERFEVEGTGWYDHEFGGEIGKEKSADNHAWNWVSTQLVDGTEVTATQLVNTATKQLVDQYAVLIMPDGSRRECTDITFETSGAWMSTATNITYPTQYRVCIDEDDLKMDLTAKATVHAQECITVIAKPAFWEGRVDVTAVVNGSTVAGLGFVERHGFSNDMVVNLDLFFKAMSKMVLKSVENFLPKKATLEDIKDAIASPDTPEYVDGLEAETFRRNVVEPIRSIVDRGGKSWRSYALMVCIDIWVAILRTLWTGLPCRNSCTLEVSSSMMSRTKATSVEVV
jgi:predicted secreted hydrolase